MLCWFLPYINMSQSDIIGPLPHEPSSRLPPHPTSRLLQSPSLSSLNHTASSHWLSALHGVLCVSVLLSPSIPLSPPSPALRPSVCALRLRFSYVPADRLVSTIFLDSIYMY